MKSLLLIILFTCAQAAHASNINGVWQDSTSTSFSNCSVIFAQKGDSVFMTHYLEFNGKPFVEYGVGTISNDTVSYHVEVSQGIPGWSTAGDHVLIISKDGLTLRGSYSDNKGNKGSIVFKKRLPVAKKED